MAGLSYFNLFKLHYRYFTSKIYVMLILVFNMHISKYQFLEWLWSFRRSLTRLLLTLTMWVTQRVSYKNLDLLIICESLGGIRVAAFFFFFIKTISVSSFSIVNQPGKKSITLMLCHRVQVLYNLWNYMYKLICGWCRIKTRMVIYSIAWSLVSGWKCDQRFPLKVSESVSVTVSLGSLFQSLIVFG